MTVFFPTTVAATFNAPGICSGRMIGATPTQPEPKFVGWGTGAGAASVTSVALSTEVDLSGAGGTARTTGTGTQVTTTATNDTYQLVATRTASGAFTVTNVALFDAASAGNILLIADGVAVTLASGDSIAMTWKLKFA